MNRDIVRSLHRHVIIFFGELTGTGFLLYFGCMGINTPQDKFGTDTQAALVWGTTVTSVVMIFGHITRGHFNPCVTTCAVILGLITPLTGLVYFVAEMLGAVLGFWLLLVSTPHSYALNITAPESSFCVTTFHENLTIYQGMLIEFIGTSMLIYAVCSAWDPRNAIWSDSVALKIGFVIIALVYALGHLTGASLNPARSFAPALLNIKWKNLWCYWAATMLASIVTTVIYRYLYLWDAHQELKARPDLSDQIRQGSLYSKGEVPDNMSKTGALK